MAVLTNENLITIITRSDDAEPSDDAESGVFDDSEINHDSEVETDDLSVLMTEDFDDDDEAIFE